MTDLPSREMVRHADNIHDFPTYMEKVLLPLALAWQSGRLVDREVVDPLVEAARLLVQSIDVGDWGWSETEPLRYGLSIVDAAIEDTG